MQTIRTSAIVLKNTDYGEYDRLYLLYTENVGKVIARVHGVRRSKNLLAGHLLPFLPVNVLLKERQGIHSIIEAESNSHYTTTGHQAVARLHMVAELIDTLTLLNESDGEVYRVLRYASDLLTSDQWWQLSFAEIVAKVLSVLGVAPSTHYCVVGGQRVDPNSTVYWSGVLGGTVQTVTQRNPDESWYQLKNVDTLKALKLLMGSEPVAHRVRLPAAVAYEAEYLLLEYMQIHVQQNLKALPFLHRQQSAGQL